MANKLTHASPNGKLRMVSAAEKPVTKRTAIACGTVHMLSSTAHALRSQANPKGDPIEVARLAGIMAAKRTGELIPLCHPLQLDHVDVRISLASECANIEATVVCHGRTGVEMEALTAVTVAALTIYDMCKAIDRNMVIGDIYLLEKSGGRSGIYRRKVE